MDVDASADGLKRGNNVVHLTMEFKDGYEASCWGRDERYCVERLYDKNVDAHGEVTNWYIDEETEEE